MNYRDIRRSVGERVSKSSGIIIYLCLECGVIDYEDHIIPGGKKCSGCGYIMENEEPE